MMLNETDSRTLAVLRHAVDTQDLNLATRALRTRKRVIDALCALDRLSNLYADLRWDAVCEYHDGGSK